MVCLSRGRNPAEPERLDERRHQMIAAAERIFLSKGYHRATMDDVAREACVSKKTIYQLVESKEALFEALLESRRALLRIDLPDPVCPPADALTGILTKLADFILAPQQVALLRLIMAEYAHSPDLARIFLRREHDRALSTMEAYLASLNERGICTLPDIAEAAKMLTGMALGEFHSGVLLGKSAAPSRDAITRRIAEAVQIFLRGTAGPNPALAPPKGTG